MFKQFSVAELGEFNDGKVAIAGDRLIRAAVKDCMDRPGETSARTVDMSITFTPVIGQEGMAESVSIGVKLGGKIPKYHTAPVNASPSTNGQLHFNDMSPDDASQMTIDETN